MIAVITLIVLLEVWDRRCEVVLQRLHPWMLVSALVMVDIAGVFALSMRELVNAAVDPQLLRLSLGTLRAGRDGDGAARGGEALRMPPPLGRG